MRIRIVQTPPVPSIDGIALDVFEAGREYEVGTTLGALLLAEGWAVPVALDAPRPPEPFSADDPWPPYLDRDLAADIRWRRRRRS